MNVVPVRVAEVKFVPLRLKFVKLPFVGSPLEVGLVEVVRGEAAGRGDLCKRQADGASQVAPRISLPVSVAFVSVALVRFAPVRSACDRSASVSLVEVIVVPERLAPMR